VSSPSGSFELDALIEKAGKLGFLWHQFRVDQHGPDVLAGVFQWRDCADVVVLVGETASHAYRTPIGPTVDVFAPPCVYWWYGGKLVWVLRALLTLPEPDETGLALPLVPAPKGTGVPGERIPVRVSRRNIFSPHRNLEKS
jgi:hypothetical protein